MEGKVISVSKNPEHSFVKEPVDSIRLLAGRGVEGDAHCGATVEHLYFKQTEPERKNLRQVHLVAAELLDALTAQGYTVTPGQLGENITTSGVDLTALPLDAELQFGDKVVIRLTGLRNPCFQIDNFRSGLKAAVTEKNSEGKNSMMHSVMAVVITGGVVKAGDPIRVTLPSQPYQPMRNV